MLPRTNGVNTEDQWSTVQQQFIATIYCSKSECTTDVVSVSSRGKSVSCISSVAGDQLGFDSVGATTYPPVNHCEHLKPSMYAHRMPVRRACEWPFVVRIPVSSM
mmetsp:Transcript_21282/g.33306  ORF Transcript_21282/g.33306 Transcript_21282/m.33306 type:complete len:105 (-) Transcript_21282:76-390(-)